MYLSLKNPGIQIQAWFWIYIFIFLAEFGLCSGGIVPNFKDDLHHGEHGTWRRHQPPDLSYFYDRTNLTSIKLAQVIFRHGARNAIVSYPKDPNRNIDVGVKGEGQLLPAGMTQAYELGKYLRQRYDGFLSPEYFFGDVFVQCSSIDRTVMTAEFCLAGLYPVNSKHLFGHHLPSGQMDIRQKLQWQPIPFRTIPREIDNKIWASTNCPRQCQLLNEILQTPEQLKYGKEANEWLYGYVSENTGLPMNLDNIRMITDTLIVEELQGFRLPDWAVKVYPEKLLPIFNLLFTTNTSTLALKRLRIGPLMAELVQNMEMSIHGQLSTSWLSQDLQNYHFRKAKVYLYSAHDTTLAAVLDSLALYDGEQPSYTSAFILELHTQHNASHDDNIDDDYIVKMFYKKHTNEPIRELHLPKCQNPCFFSSFVEKYSELIVGESQWRKECTI